MSKVDLLLLPYFLMIVTGITIPSDGNHGFFSVKSLSFLLSGCFVSIYAFCNGTFTIRQFKSILFLTCASSAALIWLGVAYTRGVTPHTAIIDQLKLFIITLTVPLSTLYLVHSRLLSPKKFLHTVIYASFSYCAVKMALVLLHMLHIVDIWTVLERIGFRYMRMHILGGLERVQTSADIVTPFITFFVLQSRRLRLDIGNTFRKAFVVVALLSTFLSFSRYLIFIYCSSVLLYWFSLRPSRMVKGVLYAFIAIGLGIWIVGTDTIWSIIERRLFSTDNFGSDATRKSQIDALMHEFWFYPYFGKGFGGYSPHYIRDSLLLHSYEVQWVAFLMQFGLLGLSTLLIPCIMTAYRLGRGGMSRLRISFVGIYLLWLLSGFTNPFLISLTSGIMYTVFWLSGDILNQCSLSEKERVNYNATLIHSA